MADGYNNDDLERFVRRSTSGERSSATPTEYVSIDKYRAIINKANLKIKRALALGLAAGVIATSAVGIGANVAINNFDDWHDLHVARVELDQQQGDFYEDVIKDTAYRVDNNKYFTYDYDKIAESLSTYGDGDFDKNVYLCFEALDDYSKILKPEDRLARETDEVSYVLDHVKEYHLEESKDGQNVSRSFRNYLSKHGFYDDNADLNDEKAYKKAKENYNEFWENKLVIQDSIKDAETRLSQDKSDLNDMLEEHDLDKVSKNDTKGGK